MSLYYLLFGLVSVLALSANLLPVPYVESEDVTNAVMWLVSSKARHVTGVTLPIDAGHTVM